MVPDAEYNVNSNADDDDGRISTAAEYGYLLYCKRCELRLTPKDIFDKTKIQKKYIDAIEAGRVDLLPKGPFGRSFVKQYCAFLNAEDVWKEYEKFFARIPDVSIVSVEKKTKLEDERQIFKRKSRFVAYLVIALCFVASIWITFNFRSEIKKGAVNPVDGGTNVLLKSKDAEEEKQNSSQSAISSDVQAQSFDLGWLDGKPVKKEEKLPVNVISLSDDNLSYDAVSQETPEIANPPAVKTPVLKITALKTMWIKASVGANVLYKGLVKSGDVMEFSPEENVPLRVNYSRPYITLVSWNGEKEALVNNKKVHVVKFYYYDGEVTDKIRTNN